MRFALQRLAFSQAESGCYSKFPTSNTRRRRPYTVMFSWSMKKNFTNLFFNKNKTKTFLITCSLTRPSEASESTRISTRQDLAGVFSTFTSFSPKWNTTWASRRARSTAWSTTRRSTGGKSPTVTDVRDTRRRITSLRRATLKERSKRRLVRVLLQRCL